MTRSPGVLRCVLDQGSHVRSMSTPRRCRPGGSAHENASLALLAVLTSTCSSPLVIVLNLARWPDGASSLHLRTELEGQPEKDASYGPDTLRIVVNLLEGASGTIRIELQGLDTEPCQVALAVLRLPVPGGLNRTSEHRVELVQPYETLCTLAVDVSALDGVSGQVHMSMWSARS